jgi:pyruvate/2-oxoglutarate dehydrogenase complex dihydrolipoamide acyltransferase (E2) component
MAASPILMPKLGLTMTEGLLAEWRVGPGDEVRAGEVIFAVETDKITSEVEARADGRIEAIRVAVGETVPVGAVVATWTGPAFGIESEIGGESPLPLAGAGGGPETATETTASSQPPSPPPGAAASGKGAGRIVATPLARRLAREAGVGLEGVAGTGPHGRIKAGDVTASLARPQQAEPPAALPVPVSPPFAPYAAMIEADLTSLLALHARLVEEVDPAFTVERLVGQALARASAGAGIAIDLTDLSASGVNWLMPSLAEGKAASVTLGKSRPEFRPDASGAPVLRQVASLAMAGDPQKLPAEDGAALLGAIARLLENPLKILA